MDMIISTVHNKYREGTPNAINHQPTIINGGHNQHHPSARHMPNFIGTVDYGLPFFPVTKMGGTLPLCKVYTSPMQVVQPRRSRKYCKVPLF